MVAVGLVYIGLIAALFGGVSLVKPLAFCGVRSRRSGGLLLGLGLLLAGIGGMLPASETQIAGVRTQLDQLVPAYQFCEVHTVRVKATRDHVYRAIKAVTADEITFFQALTWIRRLGRPGPESILNAPGHLPLIEVATRTSFLLLAEESEREIVLGMLVRTPPGFQPGREPTPEQFRSIHDPGFAVAAINFLVEDAGPGASLVTTETRVFTTDASTRRGFAVYWRMIYPGSALIRRMWLRAIRRRAEAAISSTEITTRRPKEPE